MIRSWLFVPGDHPRKMERSFDSGADALIFDWEDAVAPANKPAARSLGRVILNAAPARRPALFVRVSGLGTRFFEEDLAALPLELLQGIVLPKSCGPKDIQRLSARLAPLEQAAGLPEYAIKVVAIATETAASVLALTAFRHPIPRCAGLMWGAEDLSAELGTFRNRDESGNYRQPFMLARNLTIFAAAATQSSAIDAVFTDFRNLDGLAAECRTARLDGFSAKAAIHPDQVPVINDAFRPTDAEMQWATRVIETLDSNTGVAVLDGQMIDVPHLRLARRLLNDGTAD